MIKRESGFTMVELLVAMVMFLFVIIAASQLFTSQLTQVKQQSKIAETNIEGIIGLEMLRRDIKHAGFGLPWVIPAGVAYNEAAAAPANAYNDCSGAAPCNPPRAIFSGDGAGVDVIGSDELIIKASNTATSATAQRWTRLGVVSATNPQGDKRIGLSGDDFDPIDRVIVIDGNGGRSLVNNGAAFFTTYNTTVDFAPDVNDGVNVIYGIDPDTSPLRMPFNRADYYISTANVPARCAPNTGVFRKAVVNQSAGTFTGGILPLLDCVADFQVTFWRDTDDDGVIDSISSDISPLTAQQIRNQVKEVRVYILAHEGQRDPDYDFSQDGVRTRWPQETETFGAVSNIVTFTDLSVQIGPDYTDYRWRLYRLAVTAENLVVEK